MLTSDLRVSGHSCPSRFAVGPVLHSLAQFTEQPLTIDEVKAVEGARVVAANYELIANDFGSSLPWITEQPSSPALSDRIDRWLVENTAYVSVTQASQTNTNSAIPAVGESKEAYRPPRYFRAAIMLGATDTGVDRRALFDVKGCGMPAG